MKIEIKRDHLGLSFTIDDRTTRDLSEASFFITGKSSLTDAGIFSPSREVTFNEGPHYVKVLFPLWDFQNTPLKEVASTLKHRLRLIESSFKIKDEPEHVAFEL